MADFDFTNPTPGGSSGTWGAELNAILDVLKAYPGIRVVADATALAALAPLAGQVVLQMDTTTLYKCTDATIPTWVDVAPEILTTKGDILTYGTGLARLEVGADGQVLTADSTQALGVKWAVASGGGGGGYANPIDEPPSIPSTWDDEFDGIILAEKWAWVNQGAATWAQADGYGVLSSARSAANDSKLLIQSAPEGDFVMMSKITALAAIKTQYITPGVVLYNSGNGYRMVWGTGSNSGGYRLSGLKFTGNTAYSADFVTIQTFVPYAMYSRIRRVSNTLYFDYSWNGDNWINHTSESVATFLSELTHVGVGFCTGSTILCAGRFDWFRIVED